MGSIRELIKENSPLFVTTVGFRDDEACTTGEAFAKINAHHSVTINCDLYKTVEEFNNEAFRKCVNESYYLGVTQKQEEIREVLGV
ncbi:MAG: hypothetical protein GY774_00370 [Planctomycetes bacterium]|nr:hypothetical protein [Planctomycetota bacterium]